MHERSDPSSTVLVFAGGIALGAYQGGAFEHFVAHGGAPAWLTGSSIGAVNAAVIAGAPADDRVAHLKALWQQPAEVISVRLPEPWRYVSNWATALGTRLM